MTDIKAPAAEDRRPSATVTGFGQLTVNHGSYTTLAELEAADTLALCKLPAGHVPVDFILDTDDLDSGTPAITIKAGIIGGDDDCFFAADTVAQAGGVKRMTNKDGRRIAPSDSDRLVGITVVVAAATWQNGTVTGTLLSRPAGLDD